MKLYILSLIVLLGSLFSFTLTTPEDAAAASCSVSVSGIESGRYVKGTGKFSCSGTTAKGKVCVNTVCSPTVSIPNGGSAAANVYYQTPSPCYSGASATVKGIINGVVRASMSVRYC